MRPASPGVSRPLRRRSSRCVYRCHYTCYTGAQGAGHTAAICQTVFFQDHRDPLTESARPICWQWITVAASGSSSGAPVPRTCSARPILSQTLQPVLAPGDRRLDLPHPAARNPRRLRVSDRNTAALSYGLYFKVVLTVGSPS